MRPSQISYIFFILLVTSITASFHSEWSFEPIKTLQFLLKCLYQTRKVSGHVYVCQGSCICVLGVMYMRVRGHVYVCQGSCICVLGVMYLCVRGSCICVLGIMYMLGVMYMCVRGHVSVCQGSCMCVLGVMYVLGVMNRCQGYQVRKVSGDVCVLGVSILPLFL